MRKLIYVLVALAVIGGLVLLALREKTLPSDLDGLYAAYHQRGRQVGLQSSFNGAVLVARDGEVLFAEAYGHADPQRKQPLDVNSGFLVGAGAKPFTAMLVLQQVQAGVLDLDTPITDYLAAVPPTIGGRITLHHLLSHTAGLPRDQNEWEDVELRHEPGSAYRFSNFGYELLIEVVEKATGRGYADLLDEGIVQPLGLERTGFVSGDSIERHAVQGMSFKEYEYPLRIFTPGDGSLSERTLPHDGVLYSTVHDLHRFVRALRSHELLSEALTAKMLEPGLVGVTYGWRRNAEVFLTRNPEAPLYTHTGRLAGHNSVIAFYDDGTTVIALSNVDPSDPVEILTATYLASHGTNKVVTDLKHPSLSNPKAFRENGGAEAFIRYYSTLSDRAGYPVAPSSGFYSQVVQLLVAGRNYDEAATFADEVIERWPPSSPGTLNGIGYAFLFHDRADDALRYFQRNTELYPDDANAFDSLGECQQRVGENDLARASFTRAVEIAKATGDGNQSFYERRIRDLD